ncbi:hypothetical protein SDC9_137952 [bioreactor metagenome]|uniref:Uncharacterized protein n=1 Tax=bioreactor metagenome TaxID=1076179 RepID=A0A645DMZ9_9ZZZZ
MDTRLRKAIKSMEVTTMNPNPPTWMSSRITACPKRVKYVPVSATTKPVTQEADVAVKKASKKGMGAPVEDAGSIKRAVPINITKR